MIPHAGAAAEVLPNDDRDAHRFTIRSLAVVPAIALETGDRGGLILDHAIDNFHGHAVNGSAVIQ